MMQHAGTITLLLLEDHTLFRAGLRAMLGGDGGFEVVAEAGSLAELEEIEARPDVVVADMVLPDGRAAEVVAAVRERYPDARILVVSMVGDLATVEDALGSGAHGYLLKDAASTELLDAIRVVASGDGYVQPSLGAALVRHRRERRIDLSERERTVLQMIALGHSNSEISEALHFSIRTIEAERAAISAKLGARSRAGLVRYALDHGLLDGGVHRAR
jgi:two-component system, NarL family, response regulator NreC